MVSFSGYIHLEQIGRFDPYTLFRAERSRDNLPVIIIHYTNKRAAEEISEIKNRLKLNRKFKAASVVPALELLIRDSRIVVVLEDKDAMPLSFVLLNNPPTLSQFLDYAVNIARNVSQLHSRRIIYDDFSSSNILADQKTGEISFIQSSLKPFDGKTDESVNLTRTGAVFFEMLTGHSLGRPPFADVDLSNLNEVAPPTLKKIITKLLSPQKEERYKTAFGAQWDLEVCRKQRVNKGKIEEFPLAQKDNLQTFSIPTQLYGKEDNLLALLKTFDRTSAGSAEIAVVQGLAGMGKSSVTGNFLETAEEKGGLIAKGRCEKEYRNTPYYSLTKAFASLVKQILSLGKEAVEEWKQKFLKNFDSNARIIIDFIPEMELIIGPRPPVPRLAPDEAENRMNYIFEKLVHTFTAPGKPLLILLDSFHWADSATIQLIQSVFKNINSRYIFLILAYQQDKVYHSHTLSIALEDAANSGMNIQYITVNPLNLNDISLLIGEALSSRQDFESLARFILDKTGGNPYFVKQVIQTLYERKLIYFNPLKGRWEWNINNVKKIGISENAEELLADKINRLPSETREIIKLASCIGNRFDLELLAMAAGKKKDQTTKLLSQAADKDLVKIIKREDKFTNGREDGRSNDANRK